METGRKGKVKRQVFFPESPNSEENHSKRQRLPDSFHERTKRIRTRSRSRARHKHRQKYVQPGTDEWELEAKSSKQWDRNRSRPQSEHKGNNPKHSDIEWGHAGKLSKQRETAKSRSPIQNEQQRFNPNLRENELGHARKSSKHGERSRRSSPTQRRQTGINPTSSALTWEHAGQLPTHRKRTRSISPGIRHEKNRVNQQPSKCERGIAEIFTTHGATAKRQKQNKIQMPNVRPTKQTCKRPFQRKENIMKNSVLEELRNCDDIGTILHTLTNPKEGFYALLESDELSNDMVKTVAMIIPRVLQYTGSPETLLQLLNRMWHSKFLKQHVTAYCMKMRGNLSEKQLGTYTTVMSNLLDVFRCLTQRIPPRSDELLPTLLTIEHTTKVLTDQGRIEYNNLEEIQLLLKQCSDRIENRRNKQQSNPAFEQQPDDFRLVNVFPTAKDFFRLRKPFLRPNKQKGSYDDLDHYLDVQFRLMREDYLRPLINGINSYKHSLLGDGDTRRLSTDIRVYRSVRILYPVCGNDGPGYRIRFCTSRRIDWQYSKRLIFGSLVCLSLDHFMDSFVLATITNRDNFLLNKGEIDIFLANRKSAQSIDMTKQYVMAESPTFFESYRPVLKGLQSISCLLPLQRYIVYGETNIHLPKYLTSQKNKEKPFDLTMLTKKLFDDVLSLEPSDSFRLLSDSPSYSPTSRSPSHTPRSSSCSRSVSLNPEILCDAYSMTINRRDSERLRNVQLIKYETWPSKEELGLDESQLTALQAALTREIAIIQGPPGTGKTFIGLKIMEALLGNASVISIGKSVPVLVVCYANHALDKFLEGIQQFSEKEEILRVGGGCKSSLLQHCTLKLRRRVKWSSMNLRDAQNELKRAKLKLENLVDRLFYSEKGIVDESQLVDVMSNEHHLSLYREEGANSPMLKWLGIDSLVVYRNTKTLPIPKNKENSNKTVNNPKDNLLDDNEKLYLEDQVANNAEKKEEIIAVEKVGLSLFLGDQFVDKTTKSHFFRNDERILKHAQRNINLDSWAPLEDITNIWDLDNFQRWELYRFWLREYKQKTEQDIQREKDRYQDTANRFNELQREKDKSIMQHVKVIGMTTTGAAKFRNVLQEVGIKIVVVEEAAEVLESHVITTLSSSCEHLILIGDHQQLRPNPSVYELAEKFNLKISLFERLINNGLPYVTLERQHRMRPEISSLLLNIYPNLKNHSSVAEYADIRGIRKNYFFITHEEFEEADEESTSKSNRHEVEFLTALCRYICNQGYSSDQITILTPYLGQVMLFRQTMPTEQFEGMTIVAIDSYQGEENDIVLLSLVRSNQENKTGFVTDDNRICVALSRAKQGLYVIGNFGMLEKESSLWFKMLETAKEAGCFGDRLSLFCENHPNDGGVEVKNADDFKYVPEGGCLKPCQDRLQCGHVCQKICHNYDKEHKTVVCSKTCDRMICTLHNRKCKQKCSSRCETCKIIVYTELDGCKHIHAVQCYLSRDEIKCQGPCLKTLPCEHVCTNKCSEPCGSLCVVTEPKPLSCGHTILVSCSKLGKQTICTNPCQAILTCGHPCIGTCGECFNGRLHRQCEATCARILLCGHQCQDNCSEECSPCSADCGNRCKHSMCKRKCGLRCLQCREKCSGQCRHNECTKLCHEECDTKRCDVPCRHLIQKCCHKCAGLCGEPCICKECNGDITNIFFGTEEDTGARFVKLEDCSHVFEVTSMDKWMDQGHGNEASHNIQMKRCPKCNVVIRRSVRYGSVIKQLLMDIDRAKDKILVVSESDLHSRKKVLAKMNEEEHFENLIGNANTHHQVQCLEVCVRITNRVQERKGKLSDAYTDATARIGHKHKEYPILNNVQFIIKKTIYGCELLISWAKRKRYRLSEQEINEAQHEIDRLDNFVNFGLLLIRIAKLKMTFPEGFNEELAGLAKTVLYAGKKIEQKELDHLNALKASAIAQLKKVEGDLGTSEEERIQLVQWGTSVGLRQGAWYKCRNGHIYAIGECGRANERLKCPECKEDLGGEDHTLADGSSVATIMDGARFADWSDQDDMVNYELGE